MAETKKGAKRQREEAHNKPLKFIPGLTLSQHPREQRMDLFLMKLKDVMKAKSLHPTEFEGYTIRERFAKMGWEQLLNFKCDKIYKRVVIQWTASLSRNGDELTGIVDGKSYTITSTIIRDLLKVDTRTDLPYARFKESDLQITTDENKRRWVEACTTVFGTHEDAKVIEPFGYEVKKMTPLVQILWGIGVWTFHPRMEHTYWVKAREIYLLHALYTGDYLYGFAHLMIDDIWDMYEQEQRNAIPHGYYISEILNRLGAVSKDEYVEVCNPESCLISRRRCYPRLKFSDSPTEYIIDARETGVRVTFPKKVKLGEVPRQPTPQFGQPYLNPNLKNLTNKQSSHNENQRKEHITMITNLQKQMEEKALEAKRCELEIEKRAEETGKSLLATVKKQMEDQALDAKRHELDTEKQAENRGKSLVAVLQKQLKDQALEAKRRELEIAKNAEEREKSLVAIVQKQMEDQALEAKRRELEIAKNAEEREKSLVAILQKQIEEMERRAEIRTHAIIWDIEKQRYFYEQEQDQLRMAWSRCISVSKDVTLFIPSATGWVPILQSNSRRRDPKRFPVYLPRHLWPKRVGSGRYNNHTPLG